MKLTRVKRQTNRNGYSDHHRHEPHDD